MDRRMIGLVSCAAALVLAGWTAPAGSATHDTALLGDEARPVDVVICIDLSGSMQDLLDSVRARVWDIVNQLSAMRPTPDLRVGLIAYGTHASTAEEGWISLRSDLTDDLDAAYGELMSLEIGGGEELVGRALETAIDRMSWSPAYGSLRIVFVAGNESADQGVEDHDFRIAARTAVDRDVIVNALYVGNRQQGADHRWAELARRGGGNYSAIDPVTGTFQLPTPQDDLLLELNAQLNATYLPYGERGRDGLANQVAQDVNASRLGVESCSSRIVAKGGALYTNATWDLVDASLEQDFEWRDLRVKWLPEAMQPMSDEERQAYVEHHRSAREAIQLEIQRVSAEREAFIRSAAAPRGEAAGLGDAMQQAICEQATERGFDADGC
jgi:hypothetical protein